MSGPILTALIIAGGTVVVAFITAILAPRIAGKTNITTDDRNRLERNWTRTDDERIKEIATLRGENTDLRDAHDDLERRYAETEQKLTALAGRVESQEATIVKQNGRLSERDVEIASLKTQIVDLRSELLEAYRRINRLQDAHEGRA